MNQTSRKREDADLSEWIVAQVQRLDLVCISRLIPDVLLEGHPDFLGKTSFAKSPQDLRNVFRGVQTGWPQNSKESQARCAWRE